MNKLSLFQFKSITHRLVFGCIFAAIAIYGVSYWHARQLIQRIVGGWMLDLAQSQIDTVAKEIERKLLRIEKSILLTLPTVQEATAEPNFNFDRELVPLLDTLVDEQLEVKAIAFLETTKKGTVTTKWLYQQQVDNWENEMKIAFAGCSVSSNKNNSNLPFWTEPYLINNKSHSWGINYCVPLSSIRSNDFLAISVSLDWLSALSEPELSQSKSVNYLELGEPFVFSVSNQKWIVQPQEPQLIQSWLNKAKTIPNHSNNFQNSLIQAHVSPINLVVGIVFPTEKLEKLEQQYLWLAIASMVKDMVLMCVVIALISQRTTKPLRALNLNTQEIAKGNLDTNLPVVNSDDEVGKLTHSFRQMQDSLQLQIRNLQETTAAKQKLESELSIAAQIQRTMIPRISVDSTSNSPYEISALLKPARIVGGDLYDFFILGSDRLCLIIGDVADKGFPAALLMARTVTLIRTLTLPFSTPSDILKLVNRELCAENEECLFVTVFCGVLDLNNGNFVYASGGHDAPLLIRTNQVCCLDVETAPPLGLYEDAEFPQNECLLLRNDLILFYTDGITEAMNSEGEIFSQKRLIEMMNFHSLVNPARVIRTIQHFCHQFVGNAAQSDDITLLAVQYLPLSPFSRVANIMEWNLSINSELTELEEVKQCLSKILQAASLTVEAIEDAQLIVEEVLVNIIQYGYENCTNGQIDLGIEMNSEQLIMTFKDNGKPFNPLTEITSPDLAMDDQERSLGGFGFFLVKELAQKIDYVYLNAQNILTVTLAITKAV